jgi:predicted PurR-regulated permease PerM
MPEGGRERTGVTARVRPPTRERRGARGVLQQLRPYLIGASVLPIVATLYWGKAVLIPVALAAILTFLLSPVVGLLERIGLGRIRFGRVVAVILVVVLVFSVVGGIGWVIAQQIVTLGQELPQYKGNLKQKIADFRGAGRGGGLEKIQSAAKEVMGELQKEDTPQKTASKPVPVVVQSPPTWLWQVPSLLEGLATTGLVMVLVIFMLIERQDMRNRLIRLIGHRRIAVTTKALDEAGERMSRYILMQTIINVTYGAAIGVGLFLIGVPYAALWGFLAFAVRFIPYIGPFIGAAAPIALSLAVFTGWQRPLLTIGLFVAVELLSNMVMEPLLYGQTAGVSQVALLVAIAFWTWLWGPIGLLLATPLTVCVVVLGKYVPALGFITVLVGDEPVLERDVRYYQRLLARDPVEASNIVDAYFEEHPADQVYDSVLVPALSHTKRDREHERVTEDDAQFVYQATREIVDDVAARRLLQESTAPERDADSEVGKGSKVRRTSDDAVRVLGCPAQDEADELALAMFCQVLDPLKCAIEASSAHRLSSEVVSLVAEKNPAVLCIAALAPEGLAQTRYLCKRLRTRFPTLQILVGRWGAGEEIEDDRPLLLAAGADAVGTTLLESRNQLLERISLVSLEAAPRDGGDRAFAVG